MNIQNNIDETANIFNESLKKKAHQIEEKNEKLISEDSYSIFQFSDFIGVDDLKKCLKSLFNLLSMYK